MGAIKITEIIDYIGDYYTLFGDRKSWYGIVFVSPGGHFGHSYVIPIATKHIVQSSLKMQSFLLFQDEVSSACSVPPSEGSAQ